MEWTEKAAVTADTHWSHMNQAQNNSLSGEKKKSTPPQHSSPVISQVGKNQSGFQKLKAINSKIP